MQVKWTKKTEEDLFIMATYVLKLKCNKDRIMRYRRQDRTPLPCVWINQPWTVKIYIVDMFILFLFNFPNNKMILRIFITFLNQQFTTEIQRNNWPMETGGCLEPGYCVWCWWKLTKSGLTIIAAQPWPSPESWNNFPSGCWSQWIYQQNIHQSEIRPPNLKNTSPSFQCW